MSREDEACYFVEALYRHVVLLRSMLGRKPSSLEKDALAFLERFAPPTSCAPGIDCEEEA